MSKIEEFKAFAKQNPSLLNHIQDGSMTWQKYYEIYDIYGQDKTIWKKYIVSNQTPDFKNITQMFKKIDLDSIQKHINTAQKAIDVVQNFTLTKNPKVAKGPIKPRPLNKFYED